MKRIIRKIKNFKRNYFLDLLISLNKKTISLLLLFLFFINIAATIYANYDDFFKFQEEIINSKIKVSKRKSELEKQKDIFKKLDTEFKEKQKDNTSNIDKKFMEDKITRFIQDFNKEYIGYFKLSVLNIKKDKWTNSYIANFKIIEEKEPIIRLELLRYLNLNKYNIEELNEEKVIKVRLIEDKELL